MLRFLTEQLAFAVNNRDDNAYANIAQKIINEFGHDKFNEIDEIIWNERLEIVLYGVGIN